MVLSFERTSRETHWFTVKQVFADTNPLIYGHIKSINNKSSSLMPYQLYLSMTYVVAPFFCLGVKWTFLFHSFDRLNPIRKEVQYGRNFYT